MAWVAFGKFLESQFSATPFAAVNFDSADVRLLLLTSAAAPPTNTCEDVGDLLAGSPVEVTGSNYARKDLSGVALTISAATIKFDASDPAAYSQHASGFSDARYAVIYVHNASDASAQTIAWYDFTANKGNVTGSLTLQFSAAGIFTVA